MKFLEFLAETDNITLSCRGAGVDTKTAYRHRENDKEFAAAWNRAIEQAGDLLEAEARRRAVVGVDEPVIYQGQLQGVTVGADGKPCDHGCPGAKFVALTVKRYSDGMLMFLLRGSRPKKYRERLDVHHEDSGFKTDADGQAEADQILSTIQKRFGIKAGGAAPD